MPVLNHLRRSKLAAYVTLTALLVPLIPRPAFADDGPPASPIPQMSGQTGIHDPAVGVSETGSAAATGALDATSIDPSSGVASTSINFALPAARGLSQPRLSLRYRSTRGIGVGGWG